MAGVREGSEHPSAELAAPAKAVYALGDFTINTALASLTLIYATYFLTQVAGLRPILAGLVPLIGRAVDAFTDPAMGRLSDLTSWRSGRRRPYFLIGALPFGIGFTMLWLNVPLTSQAGLFAYYTVAYCFLSVAMTVLSIPYLALLPEMTVDYDARTSLNAYRNAGSVLGVFAALGIRPMASALGGGSLGYALAGLIFGCLLTIPWIAVYAVTFERRDFRQRPVRMGFLDALKTLARHRAFRKLSGLYIGGRIAIDLIAALLILYMTYWIGRSEDFELVMFVFLMSVALSLPFWLRVSYRREKSTIFIVGSVWWLNISLLLVFVEPEWPRWVIFVVAPLAGIGYAAVDLMPWAMLGEVIDEDDLVSGERREGLYNGIFTFIRKLGGALGVFLVLAVLDAVGFERGEEQSEAVRQTIRFMTAAGPAVFLAVAVWIARDYPLTRAVHTKILATLTARGRLK